MQETSRLSLSSLGWDEGWAEAAAQTGGGRDHLRPCRVARVDRGGCVVLTAAGPLRATLGAAVLERMAANPSLAPCTGDWATVRTWPDGPVTLEALLPRRTCVVRPDIGGGARGQALAANIDVVAVVVGLVPEPVITCIERLLGLARASGATPVVVLTKADLVGDADEIAAAVADAAPGVDVLTCSVLTGEGTDGVRRLLDGSRTLGLLGLSRAGTSSLWNALVGAPVVRTRGIGADGRGRDAAVQGELAPVPGGGVVLDTPGLRGIGLLRADSPDRAAPRRRPGDIERRGASE